MKSVCKLLTLLVVLFAVTAMPVSTHAAPVQIGPSGGMFDCLAGNLDWGCKIISFLFETTDNTVYYWKNNREVEDHPIAAITALRALLGFFSNALLIIASIKLLYEVLQMTAETAQTGKVGGKDTNQLWAPIRLVIGIGLLVPLASGLGSGQYIVLQIAKWGSGLASQGWRVFAQALTEEQSLSPPSVPRIRTLAVNTIRSYACMYLMNEFAQLTNTPANAVIDESEPLGDSSRVVFHNQIGNNICGTITFKVPKTTSTNYDDARLSLLLTQMNHDDFIRAMPSLRRLAFNMADYHLPQGRNRSQPSTAEIDTAVQEYQTAVAQRLRNRSITQNALKEITGRVQQAADTQGWTSAGSWFLAITRAQGQIITGGLNIPDASGPDLNMLGASGSSSSAAESYGKFEAWLSHSYRPQDKTAPLQGTSGAASGSFADMTIGEERSYMDSIREYAEGAGQVTIDGVLGWLDSAAESIGLWDADPRKAFGDLGGSNNPFGEMAALGHRKIRLGLDYFGLAILTSAGGGVLEAVGGGAPNRTGWKVFAGRAASIAGKGLTVVSGIMILIATLFLIAGVVLAYIVPMLPFTRFFFAILTWLASLLEAMVLVPFMALGFLTPKGEGFAGPNTKTAFFLIFQVFLRPILCVIGLIVAMILFYVAAKFLNASFYEATSGIGAYQGSAMKFMQKLVYSVMYVALIYTAANVTFKMIEHIPKNALRWMGGSAQEESYDEHGSFGQVIAAVGGQQLISNMSAIPEKFGGLVTGPAQAMAGKIASTRDAKVNYERHNQGVNSRLLASGGTMRTGMSHSEEGAVDTSDAQINQTQTRLDGARGQATDFQQHIDNDSGALAAHAPGSADHNRLSQSIQRNVNNLASMGIPARLPAAATPGYALPAPTVRPRRTNEIDDLETKLSTLMASRNT